MVIVLLWLHADQGQPHVAKARQHAVQRRLVGHVADQDGDRLFLPVYLVGDGKAVEDGFPSAIQVTLHTEPVEGH